MYTASINLLKRPDFSKRKNIMFFNFESGIVDKSNLKKQNFSSCYESAMKSFAFVQENNNDNDFKIRFKSKTFYTRPLSPSPSPTIQVHLQISEEKRDKIINVPEINRDLSSSPRTENSFSEKKTTTFVQDKNFVDCDQIIISNKDDKLNIEDYLPLHNPVLERETPKLKEND